MCEDGGGGVEAQIFVDAVIVFTRRDTRQEKREELDFTRATPSQTVHVFPWVVGMAYEVCERVGFPPSFSYGEFRVSCEVWLLFDHELQVFGFGEVLCHKKREIHIVFLNRQHYLSVLFVDGGNSHFLSCLFLSLTLKGRVCSLT